MRAAYKYIAEDDDELSFEKGEIINVVEFDDPEEQVMLLFYRLNKSITCCRSLQWGPEYH